jgi:hypothetical protein
LCRYNAELSAIQHDDAYRGDWPLKFWATVALTSAVARDTYFLHDNEASDTAERLVDKLAQYIRSSLLSRTDEELGIGAPGEVPDAATHLTPSRQGLYHWLDALKRQIERTGAGEFNYKPGKKRKKRRSKEEIEADNAAKVAKKEEEKAAKAAEKEAEHATAPSALSGVAQ